jgi:hypothetical protein
MREAQKAAARARCLAALEGEPALAEPATAEHAPHLQPFDPEGENRHQIEQGRALACVDQLPALELADLGG